MGHPMSLSKKLRFEVFKRDKFTCQYCGRRPPDVTLEADHVVPKCEGGEDSIENLTTACFDCNRGKAGNSLGNVAPALDEMEVLASVQEMLERKRGLLASTQAAREVRDAEDAAVEKIMEWWVESISPDHAVDRASIVLFLKRLDVSEISHAIDITSSWRADKYTNETTEWKYFCGICWKKIKEAEGTDD